MKCFTELAAATALIIAGGAAHATPSLSFIVDGDTFLSNFEFTNTSDDGETLIRFGFTLPAGFCIDADLIDPGCNPSSGGAFASLDGTDVTTGLTSVIAADTTAVLDLMFNDFDQTETFRFSLDIDQTNPPGNATVFGNELIGTMAFADFSDGQRIFGTFAALAGNGDASAFSASGITQTPAVPLPAGLPLALTALGAFGVFRLRQRKAA